EEIIRDRKIRKRESFLNLSKGSYLWSKIIIMFCLSAIQTLSFVIVGNLVLGIKGMYFDYWVVLFTTSCFANILGLNISSAFNSAVTIYILIPFLIIPQLLLAGVVVKFDKLNPTLAAQGSVPVSGEVMASRWAFEALAVNQFKENKYEKNFYKYDKSISVAQYKKDYWMPKLESKLTKIENEQKEGKSLNDLKPDIDLLYNEIKKEMNFTKKIKCEVLDQINPKGYNPAVAAVIKTYLKNIKDHYINVQNTAYKKKDEVASSMQKTPEDKEEFLKLAEQYNNENLNNLVKNASELNRCIEKDGRLIQQIDPVFQDPVDSKIGRAHFFAPRKAFLGTYFSTFWFNLCVIWTMSVVLIITLYFDVFKRVLDAFGNINFFQKKRA
ncbi:MAG: ATP-binding cassette protein, partial [Bacteroidetes bacterium]|nr:ATP-binding cassette protein [Bacteroidota bacterium]